MADWNTLVHDGKLLWLSASLEQECVARWKAVLMEFHGMLFERVNPVFKTLPEVLVDVVDKWASIHCTLAEQVDLAL